MYEAKFGRKDIFYYLLRCTERLAFRMANKVISPNESHREVALTRGGIKSEDIFIVQSGPDCSKFIKQPSNPRYKNNKKLLVGYVGVFGEPDGIDYLLRAVHFITHTKKRHDIHFMVMGDGPMSKKLNILKKRLGLDEFVEFTGFVRGNELIGRLSSCDVCVEPAPKTRYNDCCTMNKIIEYMALGRPVVQFDLLEGRRSAEKAAIYAQPNDEIDFATKILELLDDPARRSKMGQEGLRRVKEHLAWQHQVPSLLELYSRILLDV